jgi:hypothetical protein
MPHAISGEMEPGEGCDRNGCDNTEYLHPARRLVGHATRGLRGCFARGIGA